MTTTKPTLTFEDYLNYEDETDNRYELVDGELVALPPESEFNDAIANYLFLALVNAGVPFKLVRPHTCEVQVPVVQKGDPQNRFPDLVVLQREHLQLIQKRLTIKLDMPPPQMVVEVVSPGRINRERDYNRKRDQYSKVGIPEYWIINPELQTVTVLQLETEGYSETGIFREGDRILSPTFPELTLTPDQLFIATQ